MVAPTAADVAAFMGRDDGALSPTVKLAERHLPIVTLMVAAYTRDKGFVEGVPGDAVAAVIVSATARLVANPEHTVSVDMGSGFSMRPGVFNGWTLPELAILNRYRRRAL